MAHVLLVIFDTKGKSVLMLRDSDLNYVMPGKEASTFEEWRQTVRKIFNDIGLDSRFITTPVFVQSKSASF